MQRSSNCPECYSVLSYHSSGLVCRNCSFSRCHWVKMECNICKGELEEAEKTSGTCVFCLYEINEKAR